MNSPTFRPPHTSPPNTHQAAPNNYKGRPPNLFPNSPQVQAQMGMVNPQALVPLNNANTNIQLANGGPLANQQVPPNCHGNPPNMFPNPQNQPQMGMLNPQMQMLFHNSISPMNMINAFGMPMLGNSQNGFMMQMNMNQPFNQLFIPNCMNNLPVFQNAGFPMQNINQFVQRPLTNYNQADSCNVPVYPNQVPQVWGPQNPNLIPNAQFCMVPNNVVMQPNNQNQPNLVNNAAQLVQGNNTAQPNNQSAPPQQAQNGFRSPVSNISQGNSGNDNSINSPHAKWKNHHNKSFIKNPKRDGSQKGFSKNKNMQNRTGANRSHTKFRGKGYQGQGGQGPNFANSSSQTSVQPKKNLSLNYTAQEIQQWREERKKNHPSKAKIEKNQGEIMTASEGNDRTAKLRREQLKDVLEKQAQLGCEVAEIPSHYLYDSETQANEKEENTIPFSKKAQFQNKKFNKRGRPRQNNRFGKKQKFGENDVSNNQNEQLLLSKREPTLLQKLLSSDIRKDKIRLLQVFKFMVMNSFLKDYPQVPLKFPLVMVKEAEAASVVVEQKPVPGNCVYEIGALEKSNCINNHDDKEDNNDENDCGANRSRDVVGGKEAYFGSLECIAEIENKGEEEEGEIID